ncbi:MAG: tyrosine--tRNA ligase [bacterium]|nr:tyrosine--tRNA ligase [bacterium]
METKDQIEEVLTRGVERIYPSRNALESILRAGKKLRIYHGIDPTGKLHIGHMVSLRKLRQLQDLGHEIIVLIGDFTAMIGDPTGKGMTRKPLTREQVLANARSYKKQVGKILDLRKSNVRFLRNEQWTNKLKPKDLLELASNFTVARLLERDMFQDRIKAGKDIHVHEFLYPIFQAYDSVAMDVDLEVGGNDQTFNMLAGRTLLRRIKNKEKFVLALKLLTDSSGKKMGKSEGNLVALNEKPGEMYGKIMAWPDERIILGLEILTDVSQKEIDEIKQQIKSKKLNPREAKARLAREVVTACHSFRAASLAEKEFNRVFREGLQPEEMPGVVFREKELPVLDLLCGAKLASSKSNARRLIEQGGVRIDGRVLKDTKTLVSIRKGMVIQVGKRRYAKVA